MLKLTQSRTGDTGTCFRTCLASLLNLQESGVPDFPDANEDPYVNTFLAKHGIHYEEIPYVEGEYPAGLYLLLGVSPRGGMHVVIEKDGKLVWDAHPQDGTGRGIVEPLRYGVLTRARRRTQDDKADQLAAAYVQRHNSAAAEYKAAFKAVGACMWPMDNAHALKPHNQQVIANSMRTGFTFMIPRPLTMLDSYRDVVTPTQRKWLNKEVDRIYQKYGGKFGKARDIAPLSGKRLNAKAELLRTKHDDIYNNPVRFDQDKATSYRATHQAVVNLVKEAEALLSNAKLDDDPVYWQKKIQAAKDTLKQADQFAKSNDYGRAISYQDCAFSMAHAVIDKMRKSGSSRGRDVDRYVDLLKQGFMKQGRGKLVKPTKPIVRCDKCGDWHREGEHIKKAKAQDILSIRQFDKYSMAQILNTLGIDIKAYMARTEAQKEQLLKTAKEKIMAKDSSVTGICKVCGKRVTAYYEGSKLVANVHSRSGSATGYASECPGTFKSVLKNSKATDSLDRRTRLHRALDAVMDSARGRARDAVSLCKVCRQYIPNVRVFFRGTT